MACRWEIQDASDDFGAVLVRGNDYDQDGVLDILVGSPGYSSNTGRVTIVSGRTGNVIQQIPGGAVGDRFGSSISDIGDLNADGKTDLLIGASGYPSGQDWGKAVVLSGADFTTSFATYFGAGAGSKLGAAVLGAGDINNDSIPDYLISEPGPNIVRAISGRFRNVLYTLNDPFTNGFGVYLLRPGDTRGIGAETLLVSVYSSGNGAIEEFDLRTGAPITTISGGGGGHFSVKLLAVGDVDEDGGADFAVSLPAYPSNGTVGQVQILSGKTGSVLWMYSGLNGGGSFGTGLGAADADGDGKLDMVIGAPGYPAAGAPRDQAVWVIARRKWPNTADGHMISISRGGRVTYQLDAGTAHAGKLYLVLGSLTGVAPGFNFGGQHIPLNIDAYLLAVLGYPNSPILPASLGVVDPAGLATCSFQIVPGLSSQFVGLLFDHGWVVLNPVAGLDLASTARPVTLVL